MIRVLYEFRCDAVDVDAWGSGCGRKCMVQADSLPVAVDLALVEHGFEVRDRDDVRCPEHRRGASHRGG